MSLRNLSNRLVVAAVATVILVPCAAADESATQSFQRGYYLECHEGDPPGAIVAYKQVLAAPNAPQPLRAEAELRLARCQEDAATADFAQLMPADSLAFVEISNPGQHVGQLARLLGLLRDPQSAEAKEIPSGMRIEAGIFLPDDLAVSPDLIAELEKFRGLAAAVTSIDPRGFPIGVAVVHPGKSDLIRGLIDTGIQFLEPGEPIEGFKTYNVQKQVWIAATHRLLIISPSRDQVAAAIGRLKSPEAESLAKQPDFAKLQDDRQNALAFTYVAGRSIVHAIQQNARGQEAAVAMAALDLNHLDSLTAAVRTTQSNVEVEMKLNLKEGHHNILYGLVRTAPMTRESLRRVPVGSAAVTVFGLNPVGGPPSGAAAGRSVSVMDLGREFFGNIVEASLFVLPANGSAGPLGGIPEIGMVLAVNDPDKSGALWNQMLTLPAMLGAPVAAAPREVTIAGHKATQYQFQNAPPVVLAELEDTALVVAGTPGAVAAAVAAGSSGKAIVDDPAAGPLISTLSADSSKAIFVHAARVLDIVASLNPGAARELGNVRPLVGDLTVLLVTDESPNALSVRAEVTGMPNVPDVVKHVASGSRASTDHRAVTVTQTQSKP